MASSSAGDTEPPAAAPGPPTILGAGYVGRALLARFPHADATHRQPTHVPRIHAFDLDQPRTWGNPPLAGRTVVWTFPAAPLECVRRFHGAHLRDAAGLIVLGSTSAYRLGDAGAVSAVTVDESAPLDLEQPRVQGEEWLRAQGATVLQLAGIFGPGREPVDWLRRGRIKDGARLVNLVHVDDIVSVIAHLLVQPMPGQRLNVANGEPAAWRDLAAEWRRQGKVPADLALPDSRADAFGKRVDVTRLRALLPEHRFRQP
ncbi:MAG TPA: hypothetical protein VK827_04320 [Lysobacter sp.]|nr:hypothetical protein [Lysobacter sp.]